MKGDKTPENKFCANLGVKSIPSDEAVFVGSAAGVNAELRSFGSCAEPVSNIERSCLTSNVHKSTHNT